MAELWIAPERHGLGIGTILFRAAENYILHAGYRVLTVRTTGYATGFYELMGATIVGTMVCPNGPLFGRMLTCLEKPLTGPV